MQYWQIFSSFLIFCCYFTRLKAGEISCKIWETRKIFPILHSAAYNNNYILRVRIWTRINRNTRLFPIHPRRTLVVFSFCNPNWNILKLDLIFPVCSMKSLTLNSKLCNFITSWKLIKTPHNFVQGSFSR